MRDIILSNLQSRFLMLSELAESVPEQIFSEQLNVNRSKTLGEHFWCIVGARESFSRALGFGEWSGFNCSLTGKDKAEVMAALKSSREFFENVIRSIDAWTPDREKLLADLYEHEVMHEGQIIRLMYALDCDMPGASKWA